jgi:antitoxin PrlF
VRRRLFETAREIGLARLLMPCAQVRTCYFCKDMPSASVTSKGQITLPKEIRDQLGVKTGDRVAFRQGDDGTIVVEAETTDLLTLKGAIRSRVRGVTVEDMKDAVRKQAAKR